MRNAWPKTKLGELVTPALRAEAPSPGTLYRQIGVKLWGEGAYEREALDGGQTRYSRLFRTQAGDLIVNKIWARNGSVAVIPESLAACYASGEFPMFTPNTDLLDPRWMHWLTKTPGFWAQCDDKSRGTSGKNRIRPDQFLNIEIPLPSTSEQHRIVARIEDLSAKIQNARRLRQEAVQESTLLIPLTSARIYDEAGRQWSLRRLDELCRQITDGTHSTPQYVESGVPFLSVKDITSGEISFDNVRFITPEEHAELTRRCKPELGDILFTKVGTTGFAKVIDVDREFSIFVSLALLKLKRDLLDPKFAEYMLNSTRLREYSAQGTRGVGNKNLVLKFIREFPMPVPPLSEQHRMASYLENLKQQTNALRGLQCETSVELGSLMPSILDEAFRGEL